MVVNVDLFLLAPGICAVAGWAEDPVMPSLSLNETPVMAAFADSLPRPDVNEELKKDDGGKRGFAVVAHAPEDPAEKVILVLERNGIRQEIALDVGNARNMLMPADAGALGERGYAIAQKLADGANASLAATVRCALDMAVAYSDGASSTLALSGWIIMPPEATLWLEDTAASYRHKLEPYFNYRPEVAEQFGVWGQGSRKGTGFTAMLETPPLLDPILTVRSGKLSVAAANIQVEQYHSVEKFLQAAFTPQVMRNEVAECFKHAYYPVLSRLHRRRTDALKGMPFVQGAMGAVPAKPAVSVIVPLYGKDSMALLETQLMLFSEDEAFADDVELIYVLDDPAMVDDFLMELEDLYRIYRVPLRHVRKHANQGFAAANNLGASIAHGSLLLFLNSDVFPERPGWIDRFRRYFAAHPEAGLAGSRLLAADGSIQHLGMKLRWHEALGIWGNDQPYGGLEPELVPGDPIPAVVTGACLAIPRKIFDAVGGWSEDYIFGDFEDSDLCFKVRKQGKEVALLPLDDLVHLERQSFGYLGKTHFKHNTAIYNAVVHQEKWQLQLESQRAKS